MPSFRLTLAASTALALLPLDAAVAAPCQRTLTAAEFARPLAEPERSELVETLAAMAQRLYVDPGQGRLIAAALRRNQAAGAYRSLGDPAALASRLAADMRAVVPDLHLQVRARIIEAVSAAPVAEISPQERALLRERFRRGAAYDGHGISRVEILAGNIGYLKLGEFWTPYLAGDALAGAMAMLRDADALIIDLRDSYGGHEGLIVPLMGYFLPRSPQLLFTSVNRQTGETRQTWSASYVPGSPGSLIREDVPVYVLTSHRRTFSAAEMLALLLKRRRGATIVGERTRGGAHGGDFLPLSCRFDAFIPYMTSTIDDLSWEGVGIAPDVSATEAAALETAQRLALAALAAQPLAPDADQLAREIRQERLDLLARFGASAR